MKRKSLLILLALIICMSSFMGFVASAFSDVAEGDKHSYAITYLTEKGVIHGYEDGTYKPNNDITRAEFLTLLLESIDITNFYGDKVVKTGFADVDSGSHSVNDAGNQYTITNQAQHWAAGYIKIAVDKKIVDGYGNGLFKPDAPVTYEEAIKMVVCALGREGMAQTKVNTLKIPFWPDAYLSVGNDLQITRETDFASSTPATRGNIAQMLFNVKDVKPIVAPNVVVGGGGSGGSGGGSGGSGGGSGGGGSSIVPVTNLSVDGQVVAAVKNPKSNAEITPLVIDDNIVIDDEEVIEFDRYYLYLKLDEPEKDDNGKEIKYKEFYTNKEDYSYYLGQSVTVKYTYDPYDVVGGRDEINSIEPNDCIDKKIDSSKIKNVRVNQEGTDTIIKYSVSKDEAAQEQRLFTTDYDSIKTIYNNKVVNVAALREKYKEENPSDETPIDEIDIIKMDDIWVKDGTIRIIDAYDDDTIDLIWIDSYETYVVGDVNASAKTIEDKFRKNEDGSKVTLDFSTGNVVVRNGSVEKQFRDISIDNVLKIATTKCGTKTTINYAGINKEESRNVSVKEVDGVKKAFIIDESEEYPITDYYRTFVDDESLAFEFGDMVKLYHNSANEVFWIELAQPSYQIGYLISGDINEDNLKLKILKMDGESENFIANRNTTRYITEAFECLKDDKTAPKPSSNINGNSYRGLDVNLMLESLKENAAKINADKPDAIKTTDSDSQPIISQPVMYEAVYDKKTKNYKLTYLVTVTPDEKNSYKGTQRIFTKSGSNYLFTRESMPEGFTGDKTFAAKGDSIVIFAPNNRVHSSYDSGAGYKIGKVSSLSSKFVANMPYNIEPYFVMDDESKEKEHKIFVVYNEDFDARPNYRSENMIVTDVKYDGTAYKITGYISMSSKTTDYFCYTKNVVEKATVLDKDFKRTENKTKVEVGDVIRVGKLPTGSLSDIEIIFDASEAKTERKSTAISDEGEEMDTENPKVKDVHYFARIGEITKIDSAKTPKYLNFKTKLTEEQEIYIGDSFNNTSIFLYDLSSDEEPIVPKKTTIEKAELIGGEILFIKQGTAYNNSSKEFYFTNDLIYVVRLAEQP